MFEPEVFFKGRTQIVGKGVLYSQTSFIFKYKTSHGFIKAIFKILFSKATQLIVEWGSYLASQ